MGPVAPPREVEGFSFLLAWPIFSVALFCRVPASIPVDAAGGSIDCHRALPDLTPTEFARQIAASRDLFEPKTDQRLTI